MLKLIILMVIGQINSNDASPFPEHMYHGNNLTILQNFLKTQGLQTIPIEPYQQVSRHYTLAEFMPHNEKHISNVYHSKEYGKVGFSGKTYTEKYYPEGRYFPDVDSYDKKCVVLYSGMKNRIPKLNGILYIPENVYMIQPLWTYCDYE